MDGHKEMLNTPIMRPYYEEEEDVNQNTKSLTLLLFYENFILGYLSFISV